MAVLKDSLNSYLSVVDARAHQCAGYSQNPAADNGTPINAFYSAQGGVDPSDRAGLGLTGDAFHTTDYLITSYGSGGALVGCGGHGVEWGTTQYDTDTLATSRIAYTGTYSAGEALLTVRSEGFNLSGVTLQGAVDTTVAAIWADSSEYCSIGLLVPSSTVDGNTGKVHGESLALSSFSDAAIQLGDSTSGEQADDFTFMRLWVSNSNTGFRTQSTQVVNTFIGSYHCQGVGTGWHAKVGGNSYCALLYYGELRDEDDELLNDITPVAAIEIGSADYSANSDKHVFGLVSMDGSVDTAKILLANNVATAHIVIQCLHVPPTYAVAEPLVIAGPKVVIIESGGDFYQGMFRLIANADGRPNVIMRAGCRMRTGQSNTLLVTQGGSDGIGYLLQEGTILSYNGNGGPAARLLQTWTNNVAS